jgi:hypothetical protein
MRHRAFISNQAVTFEGAIMRIRESDAGLSVHAVAGSYVVLLGLNITEALRNGLCGFAIQRTDHTENETYWMSGTKVFKSLEPHPAQGLQYSSQVHPFQTFQWADYRVPERVVGGRRLRIAATLFHLPNG